jgi:Leucine-rich repeat (LRR) protein
MHHHHHHPPSSSFHIRWKSRSIFSIRNIIVACIFALLWRPPDPCAGSCLGVTECDCELPPGGDQPIINCKSKQLTSVPVFTPSSTQYSELTLADNKIQTISDRAFSGLYFTRLDLSGNNVVTFSNLAFNGVEAVLKQLVISLASSAEFPVFPISGLQILETLEVRNYSKVSLPPDALLRLTNLKELRIVSSRLRNLTSDSFKGQRASLLKLSLQQNQLGRVPTSALSPLLSLQDLDLSANQITQLPASSFSGSVSLQSIVMDSNPLQNNVDPRAFSDVTLTLRSLSFLSCQLVDRSLDAIKPLGQLTMLNLRQNSLINLPIDLFTHTNQLHYLILDANRLTTISRAIFTNISLITLDLRDNPLTNLPSDTFSSLTSLEELSLEGATSLRLTPDMFVQQKRSLKVLNLDRSGVGDSVWPAIAPLSVLETLTLTSTSLSSIPDFAFQFNSRLQTIDLSSNQINSISQLTLVGLENSLVSLKLNRNPFSTLDRCLFHLFKYVDYTKLGLTGIRLQCDCSLRWLFQKTQLLDPFKQSALRWNCSNGKLLTQFTESDFGCGASPTDAPCDTVQRTTTSDLFQYNISVFNDTY